MFEYNVDRVGNTTIDNDSNVVTGGLNPPIIPYTAGRGLNTLSYLKAAPRSRTITEGPHLTFTITASGPMQEVSDSIVRGELCVYWLFIFNVSINHERVDGKRRKPRDNNKCIARG